MERITDSSEEASSKA